MSSFRSRRNAWKKLHQEGRKHNLRELRSIGKTLLEDPLVDLMRRSLCARMCLYSFYILSAKFNDAKWR